MDKFPWEERSEKYTYNGVKYYSGRNYIYDGVKEYLADTPNQFWRKGDILKFNDGFIRPIRPDWKDWFIPRISRKQKEMYWLRNQKIPRYADNQLAIIIGRYRKIKFKWTKFIDYGIVIMMLTGSKAGHIRCYYGAAHPFKIKNKFPQKINFKYLLKALPTEIVNIYNKDREDTNESRNEMLYEMYKIFH